MVGAAAFSVCFRFCLCIFSVKSAVLAVFFNNGNRDFPVPEADQRTGEQHENNGCSPQRAVKDKRNNGYDGIADDSLHCEMRQMEILKPRMMTPMSEIMARRKGKRFFIIPLRLFR